MRGETRRQPELDTVRVPEFIDPRFRENEPKTLVFSHRKRAFWACFRENYIYNFGHWNRNELAKKMYNSILSFTVRLAVISKFFCWMQVLSVRILIRIQTLNMNKSQSKIRAKNVKLVLECQK